MQFRVRDNTERSPRHAPRPSDRTVRFRMGSSPALGHTGDKFGNRKPHQRGWPLRFLQWLLASLESAGSSSEHCQERECDNVGAAAALGEVSEYDLFRAAWFAWYGTDADGAETEKLFGAYLNGADLPSHVRHFVRRLSCTASDPALSFDRERFGLEKFRRKEPLIYL